MAPVFGKDGFSDCKMLCDPNNGYPQSCKDLCEGIYSLITTAVPTVSSSTSAPITSSSASSSSVTNSQEHFPDSNNDAEVSDWVYIIICILCTFVMISLVIYFRKKFFDLTLYIIQWARNKLFMRSPRSVMEVNAAPMIEMTRIKLTEESQTLLEQRNVNTGVGLHNNNSSRHYDDGKFHAISHEADARNYDNEGDCATHTGSTINTCELPSDLEEIVSRQAVQNKGVIRVTTEIKLR